MSYSYVSWLLALPTPQFSMAQTSVQWEIYGRSLHSFSGCNLLKMPKDKCTLPTASFRVSCLSSQYPIDIYLLILCRFST